MRSSTALLTVTTLTAVTWWIGPAAAPTPPGLLSAAGLAARLQFLESVLSADQTWEPVLSQMVLRLSDDREPAQVGELLRKLLYVQGHVVAFAVIEAVVADPGRTGTLIEYAVSVFKSAFVCMAFKHVALEIKLLTLFVNAVIARPEKYYDHFDKYDPPERDAEAQQRRREQRRALRAGDHVRQWLQGLPVMLLDDVDGLAAAAVEDRRFKAAVDFYAAVDALARDPLYGRNEYPADVRSALEKHGAPIMLTLRETCAPSPMFGYYDTLAIQLEPWLLPVAPAGHPKTFQSAFRMLEHSRARVADVLARLPISTMSKVLWSDALGGREPVDAWRRSLNDPFYERSVLVVK